MKRIRVHDLSVSFADDGALVLRSLSSGLGARVPPPAIGVLALCSTPMDEADIVQRMGPPAGPLFRALAEAGFLVDPEADLNTPVYFQNYAALDVHRRMLGDQPRMDAFAAAIAEVVEPGMAVMDAGTGSSVLACMAARAGARVVYAVDNSDIIEAAATVVQKSGLADSVRLVRSDLRTVRLPEKVDVIVTETYGQYALAEGLAPDLTAAMEGNLAPGGVVVPCGVELWIAPLASPELLRDAVGPFRLQHGVDLSALEPTAWRRGLTVDVPAEALLHEGACLASLPWPYQGAVAGEVTLHAVRGGTLTGWGGWFVGLMTASGQRLETGPRHPQTHWKQIFMPVEPMDVPAGATLHLHVEMVPSADDRRSLEVVVDWRLGDRQGRTFHRVR